MTTIDPHIIQAKIDAIRWRKLMDLCGTWQDSSHVTVKLWQDDAAGSVHICIGEQQHFGPSFEAVIDKIDNSGRREPWQPSQTEEVKV